MPAKWNHAAAGPTFCVTREVAFQILACRHRNSKAPIKIPIVQDDHGAHVVVGRPVDWASGVAAKVLTKQYKMGIAEFKWDDLRILSITSYCDDQHEFDKKNTPLVVVTTHKTLVVEPPKSTPSQLSHIRPTRRAALQETRGDHAITSVSAVSVEREPRQLNTPELMDKADADVKDWVTACDPHADAATCATLIHGSMDISQHTVESNKYAQVDFKRCLVQLSYSYQWPLTCWLVRQEPAGCPSACQQLRRRTPRAALMQESYRHTLPGFKDEPQQRREREGHFCSLSRLRKSWIHQLFRIGTA